VLVQELNGVLNGDDVLGVVKVDVVNEGRQGGALAAPRGPRDQDEARSLAARLSITSRGRPRASKLGITSETTRITRPKLPRCLRRLQRKRATPGMV